jgi:hypothetical protein
MTLTPVQAHVVEAIAKALIAAGFRASPERRCPNELVVTPGYGKVIVLANGDFNVTRTITRKQNRIAFDTAVAAQASFNDPLKPAREALGISDPAPATKSDAISKRYTGPVGLPGDMKLTKRQADAVRILASGRPLTRADGFGSSQLRTLKAKGLMNDDRTGTPLAVAVAAKL